MKDDFISNVRYDVLHEQKHKDGISHIVVGLFLMIMTVLHAAGKMNVVVFVVVFIPLIISILKKYFTYPRIGYAKIISKASYRGLIIGSIAFLLLLGLVFKFYFQSHVIPLLLEKNFYLGVMILIGMVITALFAYMYSRERNTSFLYYGIAVVGLLITIHFGRIHQYDLMQIIYVLGILDFLIGVIQLFKFMKKYPVVKDVN
jgi:hypothetical protein